MTYSLPSTVTPLQQKTPLLGVATHLQVCKEHMQTKMHLLLPAALLAFSTNQSLSLHRLCKAVYTWLGTSCRLLVRFKQ